MQDHRAAPSGLRAVGAPEMPRFDSPDLNCWVDTAEAGELDRLAFGMIGMARHGGHCVTHYNQAESEASGLSPARVLSRPFFTEVAPCTNNALVHGRYREAEQLDVTIDYVFTLRMRPTPVRLRLMNTPTSGTMWMAVQWR